MKCRSLVLTAVPFLAAAALDGCAQPTRHEAILADVTPELETLHERQSDMDNNWALMLDENGRMFLQDLGRAFYVNRPSRLTPEPIPRP